MRKINEYSERLCDTESDLCDLKYASVVEMAIHVRLKI